MEVVVVVIVVVSRADTKLQACCSRHRQSQPRNRVAAAGWPQPGGGCRDRLPCVLWAGQTTSLVPRQEMFLPMPDLIEQSPSFAVIVAVGSAWGCRWPW